MVSNRQGGWLRWIALVVLLFALARHLHAMDWNIPGLGRAVQGSGHVIDSPRKVGSFSRILHNGSFEVQVVPAEQPYVTVHGDDNVVASIITEVKDGTLTLSTASRTSLRPTTPVVVKVGTARLDGAKLLGSGDLQVHGVGGNAFDCALIGSGDVTVEGKVQRLHASLLGSGDLHLDRLAADTVEVSVTGSGNADVRAVKALDVHLTGSGDVRSHGHPASVSRHITGSGSFSEDH